MIAPSTPPKSRSQGRWVIVPGAQQQARSTAFKRSQARRRRALSILLLSSLVSLPVAVVLRGSAVTVSLVLWSVAFSYVVVLLGTKRQREEQLEKVRPISHESSEVQPIVFNEPARASGGWRN